MVRSTLGQSCYVLTSFPFDNFNNDDNALTKIIIQQSLTLKTKATWDAMTFGVVDNAGGECHQQQQLKATTASSHAGTAPVLSCMRVVRLLRS